MAEGSIYVDWKSDEGIEALALHYLTLANMQDDIPVDILRAIQKLSTLQKLPTSGLDIIRLPASEMPNEEAYADFNPPRIVASDEFFHVTLFNTPRLRATFGHELGHIVMHKGVAKARSILPAAPPHYMTDENNSERQADIYSDCFLMPRSMVERFGNPVLLAEYAMVPLINAVRRFEWVQLNKSRILPISIREQIEELRAQAVGANSVDAAGKHQQWLWERCEPYSDYDPSEYRLFKGLYLIRWSRFNRDVAGGWRVSGDEIVAFDEIGPAS